MRTEVQFSGLAFGHVALHWVTAGFYEPLRPPIALCAALGVDLRSNVRSQSYHAISGSSAMRLRSFSMCA
jgi:hypothetical protein